MRDHRDFGREYDICFGSEFRLTSSIYSGQEDYGLQCLQNGILQMAATGRPMTRPF